LTGVVAGSARKTEQPAWHFLLLQAPNSVPGGMEGNMKTNAEETEGQIKESRTAFSHRRVKIFIDFEFGTQLTSG
jgi:hypothetical protein